MYIEMVQYLSPIRGPGYLVDAPRGGLVQAVGPADLDIKEFYYEHPQ
jgi:hypothetical protein